MTRTSYANCERARIHFNDPILMRSQDLIEFQTSDVIRMSVQSITLVSAAVVVISTVCESPKKKAIKKTFHTSRKATVFVKRASSIPQIAHLHGSRKIIRGKDIRHN